MISSGSSPLFGAPQRRVDSEEEHSNDPVSDTEAAMNIAAVYDNVTRSIIAELEQGAAPWVKPWKGGSRIGIMPANAVTGHHYRGINVPILWHAADAYGFPTHAWLTFKRALDKGAHPLLLCAFESSKATGLLRESTHCCVCRRAHFPLRRAVRARLAICGALGGASVNSDAANQWSPDNVVPSRKKIPKAEERRAEEDKR